MLTVAKNKLERRFLSKQYERFTSWFLQFHIA